MREILWQRQDGIGLESLRFGRDGSAYSASGMILGVDRAGVPFRCLYDVSCDRDGAVRQASVDLPGRIPAVLRLSREARGGAWRTGLGEPLPTLNGAAGVFIDVTPATIGLEIRRLGLTAGATTSAVLAAVTVPGLQVSAQTVTVSCERPFGAGGGRYRIDGLADAGGAWGEIGFDTDAFGFPLNLPGRFNCVLVRDDAIEAEIPVPREPEPGELMG